MQKYAVIIVYYLPDNILLIRSYVETQDLASLLNHPAVSKFFYITKIWHTDCSNFDMFITAWIFGVKGLSVSVIHLGYK